MFPGEFHWVSKHAKQTQNCNDPFIFSVLDTRWRFQTNDYHSCKQSYKHMTYEWMNDCLTSPNLFNFAFVVWFEFIISFSFESLIIRFDQIYFVYCISVNRTVLIKLFFLFVSRLMVFKVVKMKCNVFFCINISSVAFYSMSSGSILLIQKRGNSFQHDTLLHELTCNIEMLHVRIPPLLQEHYV